MQIHTLQHTGIETITDAFNLAFSDYAVAINFTPEELGTRLASESIDYDMSVGVFEDEALIAFVLSGVDEVNGVKTIYNAGTGVIPTRRGERLVAKIYEYALPLWEKHGMERTVLEVITSNEKAAKAYRRIGFETQRTFNCYKTEGINDTITADIRPLSSYN